MAVSELMRAMAIAVLDDDEAAALALADLLMERRAFERDPDAAAAYGHWLGKVAGPASELVADQMLLDCLRRCDPGEVRAEAANAYSELSPAGGHRSRTAVRHLTALWAVTLPGSSIDLCYDLARWGAGGLEGAARRGRLWWALKMSSSSLRELETALLHRKISWQGG